jgi:putative ATP-dependent endonuclease of OLD family
VSDFPDNTLAEKRDDIKARASGQKVETFVADKWTLEYDLIRHGLAKETWLAIRLAEADDKITAGTASRFGVTRDALKSWSEFMAQNQTDDERASRIFAPLAEKDGVSKPITAQNLARILELPSTRHARTPEQWRAVLPPYLVAAIDYVTVAAPVPQNAAEGGQ